VRPNAEILLRAVKSISGDQPMCSSAHQADNLMLGALGSSNVTLGIIALENRS